MYGGLHRNLRLWRIRSIKVASKWRNEIHGNRKLSKRRYLSMFLVAGRKNENNNTIFKHESTRRKNRDGDGV